MQGKTNAAPTLALATILLASPALSAAQQTSATASPAPVSVASPAASATPKAAPASDEDASFKIKAAPKYPLEEHCSGLGGRVVLVVTIDNQGNPAKIGVEKTSGNLDFDRAAILAARDWRFDPAMRKGVAVQSSVSVPVNFDPGRSPKPAECSNVKVEAHPNTNPSRLARNEVPDAARLLQLQILANHGDAVAQTTLGEIYGHGIGVAQDIDKALPWLSKAGAQGNADAECDLGLLYLNGIGVPADPAKALEWFRKSATQGNGLAAFNVGTIYQKGTGVPVDDQQALTWFEKAAALGNVAGEVYLAMHDSGDGPSRDDVLAYAWLELAMQQDGFEGMKQSTMTTLKGRMSAAQIAEAEQLAKSRVKGQLLVHQAVK